mmetsp:Transcript_30576/g.71423  ORF Transcript_30576/g.71423 Transcript_30576/m.71423 type:complete len:203 (+) Transcript_30576:2927-3535(+)
MPNGLHKSWMRLGGHSGGTLDRRMCCDGTDLGLAAQSTTCTWNFSCALGSLLKAAVFSVSVRLSTPCSMVTAFSACSLFSNLAVTTTVPLDRSITGASFNRPTLFSKVLIFTSSGVLAFAANHVSGKFFISIVDSPSAAAWGAAAGGRAPAAAPAGGRASGAVVATGAPLCAGGPLVATPGVAVAAALGGICRAKGLASRRV